MAHGLFCESYQDGMKCTCNTKVETVAQLQTLAVDSLLKDANGNAVLVVEGQIKGWGPDLLHAVTGKRCAVRNAGTYAKDSFPMTVLYRA